MANILTQIQLERQRDALIEELRGLGNLMRGTLIQAHVKCGRKGCVCEHGEKHEESVASLVREYQRARHIIEKLTEVNLELLRGEHPGGQIRSRKR